MTANSTKMIEAARELLRNAGFFVDNLWHVQDLHFICQQNDFPKITDEEAREVFKIAHEQFDGEHGISWPQLEKALNTYMLRKALLEGLCKAQTA